MKTFLCTILVLMATAMSADSKDRDDDDRREGRPGLEGSWRVQITVRNCQTGDPLRGAFPAMASFSRGGTVLTSDSSIPPALRGTGHGTWWHDRGQTYEAIIEAFLFTPAGTHSGAQRFNQTIEKTGPDSFKANVAAEILDLSGNVVGRGCATSEGQRLQ